MENLFILLVFLLASFSFVCLKKGAGKLQAFVAAVALSGWLFVTGFLAINGFFRNFSQIPPKIMMAIVPGIFFLFFAGFNKRFKAATFKIPAIWFVGIQTFRILMEWILWNLIEEKRFPPNMTFTGRNFDILVGLTAPVIALVCFKAGKVAKPRLLMVWNVLGFLILTNTLLTGILTAPTPFQKFFVEPSNTLIAEFPFVWLPAFVVPFALLMHVISFNQSRNSKKLL